MINYGPAIGKLGKNPLEWTIRSLILADHGQVKQVIVVDDNSSDYTEETVNELSKEYPKLEYIRKDNTHENPFMQGIEKANGKIVKIQGDDHWVHPYNINLGVGLLDSLREIDDNIRVLQGSGYERTTQPHGVLSLREIGRFGLASFILFEINTFIEAVSRNTKKSYRNSLLNSLQLRTRLLKYLEAMEGTIINRMK